MVYDEDTFNALCFSIGTKGYINLGGFWEYDSVGNAWSQKADAPEDLDTISFVINGKAYVLAGTTL